jgi:hypothetical protein
MPPCFIWRKKVWETRRLSEHCDYRLATEIAMPALGHVWTAPWQELSDGLQHWSGAVTCPASHDDSSGNGFLPRAIRGELSCCRASLLTSHPAGCGSPAASINHLSGAGK